MTSEQTTRHAGAKQIRDRGTRDNVVTLIPKAKIETAGNKRVVRKLPGPDQKSRSASSRIT